MTTIARATGLRRVLCLAGIGFVLVSCQAQSTPTAAPTASAAPAASSSPMPAAAGVCRGPDVDWSALPPVAQAYGMAWNERDSAARLRLVEEAWTGTGSYVDPTMDEPVVGRVAFVDMVGQFLGTGEYFEPVAWSASDQHHGYIQMRWHFCSPNGLQFEGVDFGELAPDGRLQRVTGFFALEPEAPRPVCHPPDGEWSGIPEIARKWAAAAGSDAAKRRALIEQIFAADGSYVDPSDELAVVGYDALETRVAGMLWEGAFFEAAAWGDGDDHHDYLRLRWRLCDRQVAGLEGTDYVELDEAGRFVRVIGFFEWP